MIAVTVKVTNESMAVVEIVRTNITTNSLYTRFTLEPFSRRTFKRLIKITKNTTPKPTMRVVLYKVPSDRESVSYTHLTLPTIYSV